jgi:hypothetical protein
MPFNDTWRTLGFEDDLQVAQLVSPVQSTNTTPVVKPSASTGWDLSGYSRGRFLIIINALRTAQGATFTVTESATTNGTYTAATTSGDLTKMTASGVEYVSIVRNKAKPFVRLTFTGDNAATDFTWSAVLVRL